MGRLHSILTMPIRIVRGLAARVYRMTDSVGYARSMGAKVGNNCRFINVRFGSEPYLVSIGDHVSATDTEFITHDGGAWVFRDKNPNIEVIAAIKVGNNVYFGSGVKVLPGVTIGDNVVVGAGAIVTKDIPSNCVVVGIPAKPVKTLDEYYNSVASKMTNTKDMPQKTKKIYLLDKYYDFNK